MSSESLRRTRVGPFSLEEAVPLSTEPSRGCELLLPVEMAVGELAAVDLLVTLNVADFQRVWPAGAARVVSPQTHPP